MNGSSMTTFKTLQTLALAGLAGEVAFEIYAALISPALFGVHLQPANLVIGLASRLAGVTLSYPAAFAIHAMIGVFGFALMVYLVRRITGAGHILAGAVTGVLLWFVAQGLLAPLMGRSFMMEFGAYTQSSFIGHVGMTLVIALIWKQRETGGIDALEIG